VKWPESNLKDAGPGQRFQSLLCSSSLSLLNKKEAGMHRFSLFSITLNFSLLFLMFSLVHNNCTCLWGTVYLKTFYKYNDQLRAVSILIISTIYHLLCRRQTPCLKVPFIILRPPLRMKKSKQGVPNRQRQHQTGCAEDRAGPRRKDEPCLAFACVLGI
jgi:hypothetical protein